MRIIEVKNYDEMSKQAAEIIAAKITLNPNCHLGLATGSTPVGTYEYLIKKYKNNELDFSNVHSVNLDEYKGLSGDHDQSYRYFMDTNLFNHVNINKENTFVPNGLADNGEEECKRYNALVESIGGVDLQLLGIGINGHIGFNEPDEELHSTVHCVALTESTIKANARFFATEDEVPKYAYTMGVGNIMSAKTILLLASSASKADAIYKTCFGPITTNVPASLLQLHPNVIIIADSDALSIAKEKGAF